MNYPKNFYFTMEHEWVNIINNDTAYIGLTELAIKELKSIKNIEVHTLNQTLDQGQVFARVRSSNYLCKLIMPFRGTVIEANSEYINNPSIINEDFSQDYWIAKIKPIHPIDMSNLLSIDQYKSHKTDKMFHMIKYLLSINSSE